MLRAREAQGAMSTTGDPRDKAPWNAHLEEVLFKLRLEVNLGIEDQKSVQTEGKV